MRRKARKWWFICGVALLLVAMAGVALMFPAKPYNFLKGASLQNIEIVDLSSSGRISPLTASLNPYMKRSYATATEFDELLAMARDELLPHGFTEVHSINESDTANFLWFAKGDLRITFHRVSKDAYRRGGKPVWEPLVGRANTFVVVTSVPTPINRLQDKIHRDVLPHQ